MRYERHNNTDANAFIKAVSKLPEVIACYITSGESDFLLHVVVKDLPAYRSFAVEKLTRVPGVRDMRSSFVIGTVKEGAHCPLPLDPDLAARTAVTEIMRRRCYLDPHASVAMVSTIWLTVAAAAPPPSRGNHSNSRWTTFQGQAFAQALAFCPARRG